MTEDKCLALIRELTTNWQQGLLSAASAMSAISSALVMLRDDDYAWQRVELEGGRVVIGRPPGKDE